MSYCVITYYHIYIWTLEWWFLGAAHDKPRQQGTRSQRKPRSPGEAEPELFLGPRYGFLMALNLARPGVPSGRPQGGAMPGATRRVPAPNAICVKMIQNAQWFVEGSRVPTASQIFGILIWLFNTPYPYWTLMRIPFVGMFTCPFWYAWLWPMPIWINSLNNFWNNKIWTHTYKWIWKH